MGPPPRGPGRERPRARLAPDDPLARRRRPRRGSRSPPGPRPTRPRRPSTSASGSATPNTGRSTTPRSRSRSPCPAATTSSSTPSPTAARRAPTPRPTDHASRAPTACWPPPRRPTARPSASARPAGPPSPPPTSSPASSPTANGSRSIAARTKGEVVDGDRLAGVRRQPLLARRPDHRALDLAPLAPAPVLPDRDRLPGRRVGPPTGQRPALSDTRAGDPSDSIIHEIRDLIRTSSIRDLEFGILVLSVLSRLLRVLAGPARDRPCVRDRRRGPGHARVRLRVPRWADLWKAAADQGGAESIAIGRTIRPGPVRSRPPARSPDRAGSRLRASRSGSS